MALRRIPVENWIIEIRPLNGHRGLYYIVAWGGTRGGLVIPAIEIMDGKGPSIQALPKKIREKVAELINELKAKASA